MKDPLEAEFASRLCRLLVDKGSIALRNVLHQEHAPSTLPAVLNANKSALQIMRHNGVLNQQSWDLLFPPSGAAPDSNNFNITLVSILLRNICKLPSSASWNKIPPTADTSKSADIVRIKMFRNEVYGHISQNTKIDNAKYQKLWHEISKPLTRLGISQNDIDEIKVAPLRAGSTYAEIMQDWIEKDTADDAFPEL